MSGFSAEDVEVGVVSNYQKAGVNEDVKITEIELIANNNGSKSISMKTVNELNQEGRSKRLSLNQTVNEGKSTSGWKVSAKYLINLIMSATGMNETAAKEVLKAANEESLVNNLRKALIGKSFRGLFSSREYEPGKFAIELYITEPKGGTRLTWDATNQYYNQVLKKAAPNGDGLPF